MIDAWLREAIQLAGTPCYVFDISALQRRIAFLRKQLPSGTDLCYALKANPFIAKELSPLVDRLELCSPGELAIAEHLGLPRTKQVISGVNKDPAMFRSLAQGTALPAAYTVESLQQLAFLSHAALSTNKQIPVLLRLSSGNQFGMDADEIRWIIGSHLDKPWINIRGLQFFSGTQKRSMDRLGQELDDLDTFIASLQQEFGFGIPELEYGPGFPVAYFENDRFDESAYLQAFSELLQRMRYSGKITLELGRSIAADCGYYLTRVCDTKSVNGQKCAIVDGGIHQIAYYGQAMAMRRPSVRVLAPYCIDQLSEWNVYGSLCTANDILVKQAPFHTLRLGDILVFEKAGAYCITEGISLFLSRDLPAVLLIKEDGTPLCVRKRTPTAALNLPSYS